MPHPNKRKGDTFERQVVNDLKAKYPFAKTARLTSRLMDNCKIDITGVPMLIQCKAGYNKPRLKFDELYLENKKLIAENFNSNHVIHKLPYVLINKLNRIVGGKLKQPEMTQVTITYEFFLELIEGYESKNAEV